MRDGDNFTRERFVDKQRAFFGRLRCRGPILRAVDGKFTEQFYGMTTRGHSSSATNSNRQVTNSDQRGSGAENILPTIKRQFET